MEEIFKITDRISVLRDGQYRGTLVTTETNEDEITQLMIGRKLDLSRNVSHHELGDVALEVRNLSCGSLFRNISFEVRRGEVVGFLRPGGSRPDRNRRNALRPSRAKRRADPSRR
ncbi:hypothetical protein QW131_32665 [Roseibium salinum]|nr:hypothetical protein [Roseibium salinum]